MTMASFQDRVMGAMQLQGSTFDEVRQDPSALSQAAMVVVAAGVARGIAGVSVTLLIAMVVLMLVAWGVWSACVWIVGTKLIPGSNAEADITQVLRPIGFAQAPGIVGVLGIIPFLGVLISFAVGIWVMVASIVAVKHALGYDDYVKPIIVSIIAAIPVFIVMSIVTLMVLVPLGLGLWMTSGG
jgi:uncharacterized membrane protein